MTTATIHGYIMTEMTRAPIRQRTSSRRTTTNPIVRRRRSRRGGTRSLLPTTTTTTNVVMSSWLLVLFRDPSIGGWSSYSSSRPRRYVWDCCMHAAFLFCSFSIHHDTRQLQLNVTKINMKQVDLHQRYNHRAPCHLAVSKRGRMKTRGKEDGAPSKNP